MDSFEPRWNLARFGEFEVDRTSGVIRKRGLRLKLQDQPFRILTLLLDRRGETVTRDELRQLLWPDGTYVDFEHSLNAAVAKLRQTLGDSAGMPRYVETLARRGYRFMCAVELIEPTAAPAVESSAPVAREKAPSQRTSFWGVAVILGVGAVLAAAWHFRGPTIKTAALPVPLTSYPGAESGPSLSPDGTQVAFVWDGPQEDNADIYVKAIGSGEPRRLTTDVAPDDVPAWSPDGRWIAFVRRPSSDLRGDVFVIPSLGGVERKVATTVFSDQVTGPTLAWTSDSKWLALRDDSNSTPGLYLISLETGQSRLILERPTVKGADRGAAFSRDGRHLAFCRLGDLYVLDLDGLRPKGPPRQLTHNTNAIVKSPAWSPNQEEIIFQSHRSSGVATLWRVPSDGSRDPSPIPNTGIAAWDPAVAANGRLVYSEGTYDANIWRLALSGAGVSAGPPSRLIASSRFDGSMSLSADGRRVAFTSTRTGNEQIWVADSDGGRQVQLTNHIEGFVGSPKWSPDGALIAYDTVLNGHKDIFVVPSGGGSPRRFTTIGDNWLPAWSADGKWLYFSSERGGKRDIWRKALSGPDEVRLTRDGGFAARVSPDGNYLCYFPAQGGSLWLMPLRAGVPDELQKRLVAEHAHMLVFDVSNTGIYFGVRVSFGELADRQDPRTKTLYFYEFATGRTKVVARVAKELSMGLSISRDERWLLFSQVDRGGSDLMTIEGFR